MKQSFSGLLALGFIMALVADAWAETEAPEASEAPPPASPVLAFGGDFWTRPKLTGDWGGQRDQFAARGLLTDQFRRDLHLSGSCQRRNSQYRHRARQHHTRRVCLSGLDTTKGQSLAGRSLHFAARSAHRRSSLGAPAPCRLSIMNAITPEQSGQPQQERVRFDGAHLYAVLVTANFGVFGGSAQHLRGGRQSDCRKPAQQHVVSQPVVPDVAGRGSDGAERLARRRGRVHPCRPTSLEK